MSENIGDLGRLTPAPGSLKKEKRIGRGRGSGHGDTATKGHKGAQCRAGYKTKPGFEGGQMPIQRRVPKRGFNLPWRTEYKEVTLGALEAVAGEDVNPEVLRKSRLVKGRGPIVLLGGGEITKAFKVSVHRITKSARDKITAQGGTVEILPLDPIDRRIKKGPKPAPKKKKSSK